MRRFSCVFALLASLGACGDGEGDSKMPAPTGYSSSGSFEMSQANLERVLRLNGQTKEALIVELGKMEAEGVSDASLRGFDQYLNIQCDLNRCDISKK